MKCYTRNLPSNPTEWRPWYLTKSIEFESYDRVATPTEPEICLKYTFFSRVLRYSISHFLVGPSVRRSIVPSVRRSVSPSVHRSVGQSVTNCFKGFLKRFLCHRMVEKKLCGVNSHFKHLFEKKVCLSVCLTFFLKVPTNAT